MAEVSGLVENIQEICALIRADATELAAMSLADSPRKQANEVMHASTPCVLIICSVALIVHVSSFSTCTHESTYVLPQYPKDLATARQQAKAHVRSCILSLSFRPSVTLPV